MKRPSPTASQAEDGSTAEVYVLSLGTRLAAAVRGHAAGGGGPEACGWPRLFLGAWLGAAGELLGAVQWVPGDRRAVELGLDDLESGFPSGGGRAGGVGLGEHVGEHEPAALRRTGDLPRSGSRQVPFGYSSSDGALVPQRPARSALDPGRPPSRIAAAARPSLRRTPASPAGRSSSTTAGNHSRSCSGSVIARHTFSGGCATSRTNRMATRPSAVAKTMPRRLSSDAI